MKRNRKFALLLGLAAMYFTGGSLKAAGIIGSFTLPSQTLWGAAVLPAGDYTFRLDQANIDGQITVWRGSKIVALVIAQGLTETGFSGASSMLIVGTRVRALRLAAAGLTYNYPAHRERNEVLRRSITISLAMK